MIDTANWERIKEIFSAALEVEPQRRDDLLAKECGGDEVLRAEVLSWLRSYADSEAFIETPLFSAKNILPDGHVDKPRRFGNYSIIREIGHGGMGTVFLAKRDDGEFDQLVAIKIVRQTLADEQTIDRFKRERQILASLNHPNIAKLLDGGVTENGEPFLVMEYVEGLPITDYLKLKGLGPTATLEIFIKICAALGYAHHNLIIHRDIKPGNILVTDEGEPKLLDFGLAKLIGQESLVDAAATKTAFRALTPAYASPEQLRNELMTTASDTYSLGVVLFELLVGKRPFQFEDQSLDQIIKTVSEDDPTPPSSIGNSNLRGDLDNIVMMALRKEPERRYQSVEAFAEDVNRYLKGLPVTARPLTLKYRTSKFIKRHKVGVLASGLILLSLIAGVAATVWQARQVRHEKEKAESINAFLEQTLKYSNPILSNLRKGGQETTVNEVLDEAAKRLESGEFDASPEVKAELERAVGATYYGQGKYLLGRKHLEQYLALLRGIYGEDHPKMIEGGVIWAGVLFSKGEFDEAETNYRTYLPRLKGEYEKGNISAETLADSINNFAYLRRTQGDSHEAELLFRETLELIPLLSSQARNAVATTKSTLASTIADQGRFDEALQISLEAVNEYQQSSEYDTPNCGFALNIYGGFLVEKGEFERADGVLKQAESIFRKYLPPGSLWLGDNLRNQAASLYGQQRFGEAIEKADETMRLYEESFGRHYDNYPTAMIVKGLSLASSGRSSEGESILRKAVEIRTNSLPKQHFWVAMAESALGECLMIQKKYPEAEKVLTESFDSLNRSQGPENPRTLLAKDRLAKLRLAAAGL